MIAVALVLLASAAVPDSSSSANALAANGMIAFTSTLNSSEVYLQNADGSGARRLTNAAAGSRYPKLSPDGTKVAFTRRVHGNFQVFVMNVDGSGLTQISSGPGYNGDPDWSPDGTKLAYTATPYVPPTLRVYDFATGSTSSVPTTGTTIDVWPRWSPDGSRLAFAAIGNGGIHIYVVNADGTSLRQLTSQPGWEMEPAWSPDGTQIVYVAFADGQPDLFVMNADGSGAHDITNTRTGGELDPTWSAAGILFTRNAPGALDSLYVVQPDGSGLRHVSTVRDWETDPSWTKDGRMIFVSGRDAHSEIGAFVDGGYRRLTRGPGFDSDPSWSPDGDRLAYTHAPKSGKSDIFVLDTLTGKVRNLTRGRGLNWSPAWSPDGKRIAFVRFQSFGTQVWVMKADGSGQRPLTTQGARNEHPSWSPDGRRLVFAGERNGNWDIYVLRVATGRVARLTRTEEWYEYQPSWSPDGSLIAYTAPDHETFFSRIWVMRPDGSGARMLRDDSPNEDIEPSWAPDGKQLLFTVVDFFGHDAQVYRADTFGFGATSAIELDWNQGTAAWQPLR